MENVSYSLKARQEARAQQRYEEARTGHGPDAAAFEACFGDPDLTVTRGEPELQRRFETRCRAEIGREAAQVALSQIPEIPHHSFWDIPEGEAAQVIPLVNYRNPQ